MPWNDSPADSDALPGSEEPDPAEVVGDEDNPRDVSLRRRVDLGEADTIEERLKAEVRDRVTDSARGGMELAEQDGDDLEGYTSGDDGEDDQGGDLPAEEAAVNPERE